MNSIKLFSLFLLLISATPRFIQADDWLQWRGPTANGHASQDQAPPTTWDGSKNVVWKVEVPGRGHSSPIIVGDKVILSTANKGSQIQGVMAFDRKSGREIWRTKIHEGKFNPKIHVKNTHASPTIASDGDKLFVVFNNDRSATLTALDLNGKIAWQKKAGGFVPTKYQFGFAASPTIYKDSVIVASEFERNGFIAAFDRRDGSKKWSISRGKSTSYSSPIVANVAGKDQLLISGQNAVNGYDPSNGEKLWEAPTIWAVSCATLVWHDDLVFASGGYPASQTLCVKADGSGKIVWENRVKCYEQSMLIHDGYLYGIDDKGVAYCWEAKTGKEMWKTRMEGPVSSSLSLANGNLYFASEAGTTFVFKANPEKFALVARNKLGDSAFATPVFADNRIFTRVGMKSGGKLQEYLFCLGEK